MTTMVKRLFFAAAMTLFLVPVADAIAGIGDAPPASDRVRADDLKTPRTLALRTAEWTDDPPPWLLGDWVINGDCTSKTAEKLSFARGGYRWRRPDGSWGFARGKYNHAGDYANRVYFKVNRATGDPSIDEYDSVITRSGNEITKLNHASSSSKTYRFCPK